MGKLGIFLYLVVGIFIPVQSTIEEQVKFSRDYVKNLLPFPIERNFDTIFSSWRSRTPAFHMLAELRPRLRAPRIQVFCNRSQVTLLVDKRLSGVTLNREDVQFGDDCYSNGDLENQLVFTYHFAQCGTNSGLQNGFEVFSNSLHFNPRKSLFTWWLTPFKVPISCTLKRSGSDPHTFPVSTTLPENDGFEIKTMNPTWTHTADSNIYQRGQIVYLQVTAKPAPDQQLFIQSCFVSASPDPQTRSRHAVILNKGCTATVGSQTFTQFVASEREGAINFLLDTSHLISEVYIHCSVLISDQGITSGSKSCNYNKIQSRWEELSGNVEVCRCCSSRCQGPSRKHNRIDTRAIVGTGPLVIVDPSSTPVANSMQSDTPDPTETENQSISQSDSAAPKDWIVSGSSFQAAAESAQRKQLGRGSRMLHADAPQESYGPVPAENTSDLKRHGSDDFGHERDELAQRQAQTLMYKEETTADFQPAIRSKLQFSKGVDGLQTLTYEEEVMRPREGKAMRRFGTNKVSRRQMTGQRGLLSTFLDLLRRLDKAE
ncbi:zona pellucida protein C isoform X3 [Myripristis murdjan]|uniref:zona pellucida protein C isoform X3 n=1 Tax=Myripristis murdjan TaxID=586833 RepID=UPI001175F7AF|nr:zona pellucida sperm-binding protein 3-like isoform X3 [Myripristis murdjan]